MKPITFKPLFLLFAGLLVFTTACKKKNDDPQPAPIALEKPLRMPINYNRLTPTTSYTLLFKDAMGDSTVDRNTGRNRLRMFRALAAYISTAAGGAVIDSTVMSNMFANKNAPFTGGYADLNTLNISIKSATAVSNSGQSQVHHDLEYAFGRMAYISTKSAQTASKGVAGKNGTYLVDEDGIEWAQIIQKSLIGAYQLDYIGNVLLNTGLNADNSKLVAGKNYSELEHNWDEAYGLLTFNDMYYNGTTDQAAPKLSSEVYLGSYAWEYNKPGFVTLHSAFLRGRAAIVNNDMAEVKKQAAIIRNVFEHAIGGAANGYMKKASDGSATEASRVHAFAEGDGFIYSTRFCTLTGADNAYSTTLKDGLINATTPTFYDITPAQFTTASNSLKAKFNL